jgi:hypothetical protein
LGNRLCAPVESRRVFKIPAGSGIESPLDRQHFEKLNAFQSFAFSGQSMDNRAETHSAVSWPPASQDVQASIRSQQSPHHFNGFPLSCVFGGRFANSIDVICDENRFIFAIFQQSVTASEFRFLTNIRKSFSDAKLHGFHYRFVDSSASDNQTFKTIVSPPKDEVMVNKCHFIVG